MSVCCRCVARMQVVAACKCPQHPLALARLAGLFFWVSRSSLWPLSHHAGIMCMRMSHVCLCVRACVDVCGCVQALFLAIGVTLLLLLQLPLAVQVRAPCCATQRLPPSCTSRVVCPAPE